MARRASISRFSFHWIVDTVYCRGAMEWAGPLLGFDDIMSKPEWGGKHSCPKCGTRFYDLGEDDPISCISCGEKFYPESVLKSKQPLPYEEAAKAGIVPDKEADTDLADDDLDIDVDDDGDSPDNEVDLGGDDDLGVAASGDDDSDDT